MFLFARKCFDLAISTAGQPTTKDVQMTPSDTHRCIRAVGLSLCLMMLIIVAPAISGRGPDIRFEKEEHDFGVVSAREQRTYVFSFRNEGDEDLIIKGLRATCGCTSTLLEGKEAIPPGRKNGIKIVFKAGDTTRIEKSSVYVHSNDPDEAVLLLGIRAKTLAGAGFVPDRIRVGEISRNACIRRTARLVNTWGEELRIVGTETHLEAIEVMLQDTLVLPGQETEMQIVLGPDLLDGRIDTEVTVYTDNDKQPEISLSIVGNAISVNLFPTEFFFGVVNMGSQTSRTVVISGIDEEPLEITRVETEMASVKTSLSRIGNNRYKITAELHTSDLQLGEIAGSADVYIVERELPVKIPIYALVRDEKDR